MYMFPRLKEIYGKIRLKLITAAAILVGILIIINIYGTVTFNRISNDECLWIPQKAGKDSVVFVFSNVKEGGVTWQAGIRNGDKLIAINGSSFKDALDYQALINKMKEGESAEYTIIKKSQTETQKVKVEIKKLIIYSQFASMLFGVILLFVSFITYLAKPEGLQQKLFFSSGLGIALLYVPNSIGNLSKPGFLSPIDPVFTVLIIIWLIIVSRLPFTIFHFFSVFPEPHTWTSAKKYKKILNWGWVGFFLLNLITARPSLFNLKSEVEVKSLLFPLIFVFINAAFISGLFLLTFTYFKNKDRAKRRPIFAILISFYIGIGGFIFSAVLVPIFGDVIYNSPEYYTPIILLVLLPLAFGYSIFRYNLLDVTVVLKSTLVYATATLALGVVYLATVYVLGQAVGGVVPDEYRTVISGMTFIFLALLFQPTKDKFQDVLTRKFFPVQFEVQQVIMDFNQKLPQIVGFDTILDSLDDIFINRLQMHVCAIAIAKEGNRAEFVRSCGEDAKIRGDIFYHTENFTVLIQQRFTAGEKPVIDQANSRLIFPDAAELLAEAGVYTILPLITNKKLIGFFFFGLSYTGKQFGGRDLELMITLANQTATSLENARLYEAEAEKVKLDRDLELARKIQQGLLPAKIQSLGRLTVSGDMIPAMQVGGDYFDIIPVSDSKMFVVIGDVSGKGLSAALYMTKIQTLLQIACKETSAPAEILINLNKQLAKVLDRSSFVTMTVALFDTKSETVRFARAGHTPLLVMDEDGEHLLAPQGIGIGLDRTGSRFQELLHEEELPFKKNQIFAFFSDGISEALNESGSLYDSNNLIKIIRSSFTYPAERISENVFESVRQFSGRAGQQDDITLVLVKPV
ncbi:MAG: hypothetical protein AMXMBFR48_08400 [Ignavibacteriales bacterium]